MKHFKKISYIVGLALILVLGMFMRPAEQTTAASCATDSSLGNLFGIVTATNLPDPIYVSLDTWNADPLGLGNATSSVDFSVKFDRNSGLWSGRAWNETVGWIDFETNSIDKQAFVEEAHDAWLLNNDGNPANDDDSWGNWDGIINIENISYSNQAGTFVGVGISEDYTGDPDDPGDDSYVGLGEMTFSGVTYVAATCVENINIFLNDTPTLYRTNCPISAPKIKWSSENVSNCVTDSGSWSSPGSRANQNKTGETASAGMSSSGSKVFKIKCVGDISGNDVYGSAVMSCGTGQGVINNSGTIIAPIIKEA